jgi:hypothetical protein
LDDCPSGRPRSDFTFPEQEKPIFVASFGGITLRRTPLQIRQRSRPIQRAALQAPRSRQPLRMGSLQARQTYYPIRMLPSSPRQSLRPIRSQRLLFLQHRSPVRMVSLQARRRIHPNRSKSLQGRRRERRIDRTAKDRELEGEDRWKFIREEAGLPPRTDKRRIYELIDIGEQLIAAEDAAANLSDNLELQTSNVEPARSAARLARAALNALSPEERKEFLKTA